MSSVAPTDSASQGGRKSRPGKRERQAARSAVGSSGGLPASPTKAQAFAQGISEPVPQPGKFPVVFPTGAGEPTRDQEIAIPVHKLSSQLPTVAEKYKRNPRYAEFRAHSEFNDAVFGTHLSMSFLLYLAQHLVHAHVNMGLPQGDFAPVASSDIRIPQALSSVASQYGEFQLPVVGTRYLLRDYENAVKRVIYTASRIWAEGRTSDNLNRSWLPMSASDGNFKAIVAERLKAFIAQRDVSITGDVLEAAVLSGDIPAVWEEIKDVLGYPPEEGQPDERDRFDFIFQRVNDVGQFTTHWTTAGATAVLQELGLSWPNPNAGQLDWNFNAKQAFTGLAEQWTRLSAAYVDFFELSSGLPNRQEARGTPAQMAQVTSVEGVTVVKTFIALSAPEFSLVACFPAPAVFVGNLDRRVVVTTSQNVSQRATEFCQLDWR